MRGLFVPPRRLVALPTVLAGGGIPDDYPTTFDYYISPSGSDSNNGLSVGAPWKTFSHAFSTMSANTRLGLLDGTYSSATGTGAINHVGTGASNEIPNGTSGNFTEICSVNPGGAVIDGTGGYNGYSIFVGRLTRHDSYIKFRGMKCLTTVALYNCERIYVKDVGAKFGFSIGTNDTSGGVTVPSSYNLIEDCWAWGGGASLRLASSNYQSHNNVWRRVVIRKDGGGPTGGGNPNVVFTVYNSKHCSIQNVFSVDRVLGGEEPYGDFATAQHDGVAPDLANFYFGDNEWLGCASINSEDEAFAFEADNVESAMVTWRMRNCVAYPGGFNMNAGSGTSTTYANCDVQNITALGMQIRLKDLPVASILKNSIVANSPLWGVNGGGLLTASYVDRYNNTNGDTGTTVTNGSTFDPLSGSPASLLYPFRIETGSSAKGAGESGADLGATIIKRYGQSGLFYGDSGYNTLSSDDLWPYPNEARIKADMAADSTRGFCAAGESLTHYLWNQMGNGSPY